MTEIRDGASRLAFLNVGLAAEGAALGAASARTDEPAISQ